MNIIFDNKAYYIQKFGGVSVVFNELQKRALMDSDAQCKFIEYGNDGNLYQKSLNIPEELIIQRSPLFFGLKRLFPVSVKMDKPFVFQSTYFSFCSNPNAININTVHDFIEVKVGNDKKGSKLRSLYQGYIIGKSDVIVCISENTKRDLFNLYPHVKRDKVHVIYNSASDIYHIKKNVEKELPFPKGTYLIYVGARAQRKNYHLLRDVIGQTNYNLVIVGSKFSEEEKQELEKHIPTSRYVDLGFTEDERLNELYNNAAALVYPSSYEGFGIPVLEAQQAGCPVIALNTSSIPEVISSKPENCPLLMQKDTKEELLSKIRLLSNKDLMAQVSFDGLENAKRFSWDKMYYEYRCLYEKLLNI